MRPDGEIRWVSANGFPVIDESCHQYQIVGIARDITELKNVQEYKNIRNLL